jgi:hypothetical protein
MASSRLHQLLDHLAPPARALSTAAPAAAAAPVAHPKRFAASTESDRVEEQAKFFSEHGYCFVEGAVAGAELLELQHAYATHAQHPRALWEDALQQKEAKRHADSSTFGNTSAVMQVDMGPPYGTIDVHRLPDHSFDIPLVAELDEAFVKLAEPPSLMPVLFKIMGPDLQLMQINLRTTVGNRDSGQGQSCKDLFQLVLSGKVLTARRGWKAAGGTATWRTFLRAGRTPPSPRVSRSSRMFTMLSPTVGCESGNDLSRPCISEKFVI